MLPITLSGFRLWLRLKHGLVASGRKHYSVFPRIFATLDSKDGQIGPKAFHRQINKSVKNILPHSV
jgi:hypothetical protein